MRTGGCTVQQALTAEAATVVKQAVTLATRRGHAQVTPLHVANTMLASPSGLLRTACLKSHSHPLQCKALELCFNVALNRLPASTSSPMLGPHCHPPCPQISNALVAAFKRAQAHQRRGSIESQQQPSLAVKIELDQLIISILDDPSVSRVMREAGFSSPQVKSNVEQAVSLEICSQSAPLVSSTKSKESKNVLVLSQSSVAHACSKSIPNKPADPIRNEDVMSVMDSIIDKRRSIVIVGECSGTVEGVVRAVMDKIHQGDVPEFLRELRFETLSIPSFGHHLSKIEIEDKLEEVKAFVKIHKGKGVVLNVGDLKWAIGSNSDNGGGLLKYMITEVGKLACEMRESNGGKFWMIGTATFQTYMKCKSTNPSLELLWGLHPLIVPAGSLRFTLTAHSNIQSPSTSTDKDENGWTSNRDFADGHGEGVSKQLTCCADCSAKLESEARSLQNASCNTPLSTTSNLPAWLQQYKNENRELLISSNDQDCVSIKDLCKRWNSFCSSVHHQPQPPCSDKNFTTFSSISPSSSISIFSDDHYRTTHHDWPAAEPKRHSWRDQQPHFWNFGSDNLNQKDSTIEPSLRMCISTQPLSSNMNHGSTTPNSTSSSELVETENYVHKFKELNAENLKTLCNALEKKVPWQKDIIADIASTILQCRSGLVRRKLNLRSCNIDQSKEETWFFFQGVDIEGKEKIARELAKLVFGRQNDFVSISLSSFSSTRADSTEDCCRKKRSRDEQSSSYIEKFSEAVSSNPHRVFFIEDVEQADYFSQMGFKRAIERGKISKPSGEEVGLRDAIIILSCESFSSRSRACSPQVRHKMEEEDHKSSAMEETVSPSVSIDLNISIEDDEGEDDESIDDIGLLESVDRRIMFKLQDL